MLPIDPLPPTGPYAAVRAWLASCRRPLVVTHRRPDGDALGAVAAMTLAAQRLGLRPLPVVYEPLPPRYAMVTNAVKWRRWDLEREELIAAADAVVIVDTCSWSQLEPIADYLRQAPRTLVIDHHPTRDAIGLRPGDLQWFDESAGALCLMLTEWVQALAASLDGSRAAALDGRLPGPLDRDLAVPLLVGLATDCGWFRFANTDTRMLRAAAALVDAGAPAPELYRQIYERDSPAKLRLIGRMLLSLEMHAGGQLAMMQIRAADFAAAGADPTATEDIVNEAGRLEGIEAVVLFTEEPGGAIRVNLRSKTRVDVAAIASRFGGGGHARAAGARPAGRWDEVVPAVRDAVIAALT